MIYPLSDILATELHLVATLPNNALETAIFMINNGAEQIRSIGIDTFLESMECIDYSTRSLSKVQVYMICGNSLVYYKKGYIDNLTFHIDYGLAFLNSARRCIQKSDPMFGRLNLLIKKANLIKPMLETIKCHGKANLDVVVQKLISTNPEICDVYCKLITILGLTA